MCVRRLCGVQVRGFAGWPGTCTSVRVATPGKDDTVQVLKVLRTRVAGNDEAQAAAEAHADDTAAGASGAPEVAVTKAGVMRPGSGFRARTAASS